MTDKQSTIFCPLMSMRMTSISDPNLDPNKAPTITPTIAKCLPSCGFYDTKGEQCSMVSLVRLMEPVILFNEKEESNG